MTRRRSVGARGTCQRRPAHSAGVSRDATTSCLARGNVERKRSERLAKVGRTSRVVNAAPPPHDVSCPSARAAVLLAPARGSLADGAIAACNGVRRSITAGRHRWSSSGRRGAKSRVDGLDGVLHARRARARPVRVVTSSHRGRLAPYPMSRPRALPARRRPRRHSLRLCLVPPPTLSTARSRAINTCGTSSRVALWRRTRSRCDREPPMGLAPSLRGWLPAHLSRLSETARLRECAARSAAAARRCCEARVGTRQPADACGHGFWRVLCADDARGTAATQRRSHRFAC